METLTQPWTGLARIAAHVDLWPFLRALGGPERASTAPRDAWADVGLPLVALAALGEDPWPGPSVCAASSCWPHTLTGLPAGPVALQVEGDLSLLGAPAVAIVGARSCTAYGREWATRISRAVVEADGVVVSGLARGIDTAAHEAAGGRTIAVLGQGLQAAHPSWQGRLRDRILAQGGLVLSELAPHTHADVHTFPIRNRIVAGLARAVVVVEAGHRSGAKNTVAHALRYGREVLAVPGPLHADASAGCLDLLEEGATMVRGERTVLESAALKAPSPRAGGGDREDLLMEALRQASRPDELAALTGLPTSSVHAGLGALELQGRVARLPGQRYIPRPP